MATAIKTLFRGNTAPNVTLFPSGGALLSTGEMNPWGNFAIGMTTDELSEAATRLSSGEFPAMIAWPGSRNPEVDAAIEPYGFEHVAATPAMKVDLKTLSVPALPSGYTFKRLTSDEDGMGWATTLIDGYPVPPLAGQSLSPVHYPMSDERDAEVQYFVVRCESGIVGVSCLVLADGIAGVYCVATLAEHRRKGIGAVLTAAPLAAARELGFETGVLQASDDGYPVYLKLGFVDAGEVQIYLRIPQVAEAEV